MRGTELIKNLKSLKGIEPDAGFVSRSRMAILSCPKRMSVGLEVAGHGVLAQSFNFGMSMVLTAVTLMLVLGGATAFLRTVFINNLPGLDTEGLLTEAQNITKDIDIELREAEYYAVTAKETSVALREASANGPAHTNPLLIEREAQGLEFQDPTNNDIDELLNISQ